SQRRVPAVVALPDEWGSELIEIGNGQSGMGNRGGSPPPARPPLFFVAPEPVSRSSAWRKAWVERGSGGRPRPFPIPTIPHSRLPIPDCPFPISIDSDPIDPPRGALSRGARQVPGHPGDHVGRFRDRRVVEVPAEKHEIAL